MASRQNELILSLNECYSFKIKLIMKQIKHILLLAVTFAMFLTPEQVWTVNYTSKKIGTQNWYYYSSLTANDIPITNNWTVSSVPISIEPWDLGNYSIQWEITTQLFRAYTQSITNTNTNTASYSENASGSFGIGGLKISLGITATQTNTQTFSIVTTVTSYPFGDVTINYTDGIYTNQTLYQPYGSSGTSGCYYQTSGAGGSNYNTGIIGFQISPQQLN